MDEVNRTPAAKAAMDKEWRKLQDIGCWDLSSVRELDDVKAEALAEARAVHFGCVFQYATKNIQSYRSTSVSIRDVWFSKATMSKMSRPTPLFSRI